MDFISQRSLGLVGITEKNILIEENELIIGQYFFHKTEVPWKSSLSLSFQT
jgi:hypothetical protein